MFEERDEKRYLNIEAEHNHALPRFVAPENLSVQYRVNTVDYRFSNLLVDSYEVHNYTSRPVLYPVLPYAAPSVLLYGFGDKSKLYLCGPITAIRKINLEPGAFIFCERCWIGTMPFWTYVDVGGMLNDVIPFSQGAKMWDDFSKRLFTADTFHKRNLVFESKLDQERAHLFARPEVIKICSEEAVRVHGFIKVSELAKKQSFSERYMRQIFNMHTGISPKMYCEILQLQHLVKMILTDESKLLQDIATEYAFFDLKHMNTLLKKFLGCTSSDIRKMPKSDSYLWSVKSLINEVR